MKKTITVYAITTIMQGKKKFLSQQSKRADNRIVPVEYSENEENAHSYNDAHLARTAITNIINPHGRKFEVEPIQVIADRKKQKIFNDEL